MSVPARIGTCVSASWLVRPRPRVDMDDARAALLGLHHPAEAHRVRLGHRSPRSGYSPSAGGPAGSWSRRRARTRTPDRGPWSCVISAPGSRSGSPPSAGEQLLDQVVLFVVERRAAEVREAQRAVHSPAVIVSVLPAALARSYDALGDHVHRLLEFQLLPIGAARPPVLDPCEPARLLHQLTRGGALGAQSPLVDRRARVPSMSTSSPWRVYTSWPHPTAQKGHTDSVTFNPAMRASARSVRSEPALGPRPQSITRPSSGSRLSDSNERGRAPPMGSSPFIRSSVDSNHDSHKGPTPRRGVLTTRPARSHGGDPVSKRVGASYAPAMSATQEILDTVPGGVPLETADVAAAIDACLRCVQTCTACANADIARRRSSSRCAGALRCASPARTFAT